MRGLLSLTGCVAVLVLGACGAEPSADSAEGIRIEARQTVLVTDEPLGDVVHGKLEAGNEPAALCYVAEARTNRGVADAAIKITSGGLSGYTAVTDFRDDPADRVMVFDVNDSDLRARLPSCRP